MRKLGAQVRAALSLGHGQRYGSARDTGERWSVNRAGPIPMNLEGVGSCVGGLRGRLSRSGGRFAAAGVRCGGGGGHAGGGGDAEDANAELAELLLGCLLRCVELGAHHDACEPLVQLVLHMGDVRLHALQGAEQMRMVRWQAE